MTKIAIVGFGGHVTKNILPALTRMGDVTVDAIYVRDINKYNQKAKEFDVKVRNLDFKLDSDVCWVYIATPISTHYDLASKFLNAGKNVICEKPLADSPDMATRLFDLAKKNKVVLQEVCMYKHHKQYTHLQSLVEQKRGSIKTFSAQFTIPHLAGDNIRYNRQMGGGALLDVGFYPVSIISSLFGEPKNINFISNGEDGFDVDLFGIATFAFEGFYCCAQWGIGLPYSNFATFTTERQVITYDRIFSKPENLKTNATVHESLDVHRVDIGEDDQFVNMFRNFFQNRAQDVATSNAETICTQKSLAFLDILSEPFIKTESNASS